MKKIILFTFLLFGFASFSQVPSYLTDNQIQFSVKAQDNVWYKTPINGARHLTEQEYRELIVNES